MSSIRGSEPQSTFWDVHNGGGAFGAASRRNLATTEIQSHRSTKAVPLFHILRTVFGSMLSACSELFYVLYACSRPLSAAGLNTAARATVQATVLLHSGALDMNNVKSNGGGKLTGFFPHYLEL